MTTTLIAAAVLLLISVLASKASSRFGVPALLLFLAIGMLAGSEGPGRIYYNEVEILLPPRSKIGHFVVDPENHSSLGNVAQK